MKDSEHHWRIALLARAEPDLPIPSVIFQASLPEREIAQRPPTEASAREEALVREAMRVADATLETEHGRRRPANIIAAVDRTHPRPPLDPRVVAASALWPLLPAALPDLDKPLDKYDVEVIRIELARRDALIEDAETRRKALIDALYLIDRHVEQGERGEPLEEALLARDNLIGRWPRLSRPAPLPASEPRGELREALRDAARALHDVHRRTLDRADLAAAQDADAALARVGPPPAETAVTRIVAELRARATSEDITADRKRAKVGSGHNTLDAWSHEKNDHASEALREEADRIEREHGGRS